MKRGKGGENHAVTPKTKPPVGSGKKSEQGPESHKN